jgi:hypothetical protein
MYFSEFKKDLHRIHEEGPSPTEEQKEQIEIIEEGIDKLIDIYAYLRKLINNYDEKLYKVV